MKKQVEGLIRKPLGAFGLRKSIRRVLSMVLTICLVAGGMPAVPLSAAAAAAYEAGTIQQFALTQEDLMASLAGALADAEPVRGSALRFSGAEKDVYDELFYWNDVYELFPEIETDHSGHLSLRVFARLTGEGGMDSLSPDGSEQFIFLLLNKTDDEQRARISIDDYDTGSITVAPASEVALGEELPEVSYEIIIEPETAVAAEELGLQEELESYVIESQTILPAFPSDYTGAEGIDGASGTSGCNSAPGTPGAIVTDSEVVILPSEGEDLPIIEPFDDGSLSTEGDYESADAAIIVPDVGIIGLDAGTTVADTSATEPNAGATVADKEYSDAGTSVNDDASTDNGNSGYAGETDMDQRSEAGTESETDTGSDAGNESDSYYESEPGSANVGDVYTGTESHSEADSSSVSGSVDDSPSLASRSRLLHGLLGAALAEEDIEDPEAIMETASASDAEYYEEYYPEISGTLSLCGDIYDAVLINGNISAVAFVTTLEDLGFNDFHESEAFIPEEQTIRVDIYTDETYDTKLSDGTAITLTGIMPPDMQAKAYPVDVELDDVYILAAYDITIFDEYGNEYQPDAGAIEVKIENEAIREALKSEHELSIYHLEDEEDAPEMIAVIEPASGLKTVRFSAESFSIYVVGDNDELKSPDGTEHFVYTVNFYDKADGVPALLSTQIVSPGEKLKQPPVPDKEHYLFKGWYAYEDGEWVKYLDLTTDALPLGITEDTVVDLYAHYEELYYVYFMADTYAEKDTVQEATVFHTEVYEKGDELITSEAERLYLAKGYLYSYKDDDEQVTTQAVTAWRDEDGKDHAAGEKVIGHLELYPVVEDATWIYFDVNKKDTSVDPVYVLASRKNVGELPEAECTGYTFAGWYTQADGGAKVDENTELASLEKGTDGSVTLYAHWEAQTVPYTINIWRQKPTDGQAGLDQKKVEDGETYDDYIGYYDIGETIHVSALQSDLRSDQVLSAASANNNTIYNWNTYTSYATTTNTGSAYYGFEYGTTDARTRTLKDLEGTVVASDGSTIINIFYNRITVTWTFYDTDSKPSTSGLWPSKVWGTLIGLYDTNLEPQNGSEAAGSIKTGWTQYTDPGSSSRYVWRYYYSTGYSYSYRDIVTFETRFRLIEDQTDVEFSRNTYSGKNKLHYYLEVTNEGILDENGAKAQEAAANGALYTKMVSRTAGGQTVSKKYVYDRTIFLENSLYLSDKYSGYHLAGSNQQPVSASSTMTGCSAGDTLSFISNGTCLYNDAYEYTITLVSSDKNIGIDTAGGLYDGGNHATYTFKYGAPLDVSLLPSELNAEEWGPNRYSYFTGAWYTDTTMNAPFELPETMPNNNLLAYADWQVKTIKVDFVTSGHSDVPESQTLLAASTAEEPPALTNVHEGYTHMGWVDQNGKIFNFATVLYDDTTLTAIWKNANAQGHELTYNLNLNGKGDMEDDTLKYTYPELFAEGSGEDILTVEAVYDALYLSADEGRLDKFICWNTQSDGSGDTYFPEDEIMFTGSDITLYAIWAVENEATLHLDYNYPSGEVTEGYEYPDKYITEDNLTSIDLDESSDIHKGDTIAINGITYRFEGWSANNVSIAATATRDDVEIEADALVAVDNLSTLDANTLHAVWLAVYDIIVTKEVVYPGMDVKNDITYTYSFEYSVDDGETQTISGIADGASFDISDVENGDKVSIHELDIPDDCTVSYEGAYTIVSDDGDGICIFIMDPYSTSIIVTNTFKTVPLPDPSPEEPVSPDPEDPDTPSVPEIDDPEEKGEGDEGTGEGEGSDEGREDDDNAGDTGEGSGGNGGSGSDRPSGGNGGGSSFSGGGSVTGGPGMAEEASAEDDLWNLKPLAQTGEAPRVLIASFALTISAMALFMLLLLKRKKKG